MGLSLVQLSLWLNCTDPFGTNPIKQINEFLSVTGHTLLGIAGMFTPLADVAEAYMYYKEGDTKNALQCLISAIPLDKVLSFTGKLIKVAAKGARKTGRLVKNTFGIVTEAVSSVYNKHKNGIVSKVKGAISSRNRNKAAKAVDAVSDATKKAEKYAPEVVEDLNKAAKKYDKLVDGVEDGVRKSGNGSVRNDFYVTKDGTIIPSDKVKTNSQYDRLEVELYSGKSVRPNNAIDDWNDFLGDNQSGINPFTGTKSVDRIWSADGKRSIRFGEHEMGGMGTRRFHYHRESWYDDYVINEVQRIQQI